MTTRVRSFTVDRSAVTAERELVSRAESLWRGFMTAARISTGPAFALAWAVVDSAQLGRDLPDVEGEPPVEIETTERSRRGLVSESRLVRIYGPRRPIMFEARFVRTGMRGRGAHPQAPYVEVELPLWTLVSASVNFGPAGSLDRAWAVLELFAGWDAETASGWEMDEIADALSEVPELCVAFVHDGESGPSLSYAERLLLDHLLGPVRAELRHDREEP